MENDLTRARPGGDVAGARPGDADPGGPRGRRVLLVEDDPDILTLFSYALHERGGYEVDTATSVGEAVRRLEATPYQLLLTDLGLPGGSGLALLDRARVLRPGMPVVLVTGQASVGSAVDALRNGATDYLQKPVGVEQLLGTVGAALDAARRRRRHVLAVGAHPDDVEIGVGGLLAEHTRRGDEVTILTLSRGAVGGAAVAREAEARAAAKVLGATLILGDLEDTRIPEHGPTITAVEDAIRASDADVVYVHSLNDNHQDHRSVHRAVVIASRGVPGLFAYQSPSATTDFRPNRYVPVDTAIVDKLAAIASYRSQTAIRRYLEDDLITATARYWGRFAGYRLVEPLEVLRDQTGEQEHGPLGRTDASTGTDAPTRTATEDYVDVA